MCKKKKKKKSDIFYAVTTKQDSLISNILTLGKKIKSASDLIFSRRLKWVCSKFTMFSRHINLVDSIAFHPAISDRFSPVATHSSQNVCLSCIAVEIVCIQTCHIVRASNRYVLAIFWYGDCKNVRKYGLLKKKKKNTAANLPKITTVKSSVDFVNPLKFVIAAAVLPVSAHRP